MPAANFPYRWYLSNGYPSAGVAYHGCTVFGTFICGGGSTMGYKLAGYNHLGGVEMDKPIADVYKANHKPKYLFNEDIRTTLARTELPAELYDVDIFDGSPPCSTFSMSGNREDDWGVEKEFREGQALQRLDDLFFDYLKLAARLRPKVILAENVTGLIKGNARAYMHDIIKECQRMGYKVQLFKLNAASMGVPQARERVFIIAHRPDLQLPKLELSFNLPPITFGMVEDQVKEVIGRPVTDHYLPYWKKCKPGASLNTTHPLGYYFNSSKVARHKVVQTVSANDGAQYLHHKYPHRISDECLQLIGSFPLDYDFQGVQPQYLIGMSVPPVMVAHISAAIYEQWLSKL